VAAGRRSATPFSSIDIANDNAEQAGWLHCLVSRFVDYKNSKTTKLWLSQRDISTRKKLHDPRGTVQPLLVMSHAGQAQSTTT
jgi:hypothetical protein